jgi:pyruvate formate lyase activating enzyme
MSGLTGIISEIREFCLHDGPGVRTTVFFKGCPLRCLWCHNPELRPFGAEVVNGISCGEVYTVARAAGHILRDREILVNSGGGVTFSGGEVLAQIDFASELAHALGGLHIAVETAGMASRESYCKMLGFSDLIYQDIKCASSGLHKKLTGLPNELILNNIRLLQKSGKAYIIGSRPSLPIRWAIPCWSMWTALLYLPFWDFLSSRSTAITIIFSLRSTVW